MKRLFITFLCLMMVAVFLPTMAFAASPDFTQDAVTLTESAVVDSTVTIDKDKTIDLGANELTYSGASGTYLFDVVGGAKLTIKNGTILSDAGRGVKVTDGSVIFENVTYTGAERALGIYGGSAQADAKSVFNVTGTDAAVFVRTMDANKPSTFDLYGEVYQTAETGGSFGVAGNGTDLTGKTVINIHEGAVVSSNSAPAIYHPHNGQLTVAGQVEGLTGIEIRAGKLTVEPTAIIIATGDEYRAEENGNGSTSTGAAIAANQHATKEPIDVVINGGMMGGAASVVADGVQNDVTENVKINIYGGMFEGQVKAIDDGGNIVLEGGAFNDIDHESVTVEAADSATFKDSEEVFEIIGLDYINAIFKELGNMAPELLAEVSVEITKAGEDSNFVVPAGLTVKNSTDGKISVNDADVDAGEEITVEVPEDEPQKPDTDDPKDPDTDKPNTDKPDADKKDDKEVKKPVKDVSKTGDETTILPWIALMMLAAGTAAALKKKEN